MNKKGFLLGEETLKIVIAVICILFLVYFLTSLYLSNKGGKDLEQAEASLDYLIEGINSGSEEVEIYNPSGWQISSWPFEERIPNSCSNVGWESCVCICQKNNVDVCDDKGICLESEFTVLENENSVKIDNPPLILTIDYENKIISKKEV